MRVESSIQLRNGGWLHRIGDPVLASVPRYIPRHPEPEIDFQDMWERWFKRTDFHDVDGFAASLGVDPEALGAIGAARAESAWAFPMRNARGEIVGIRLRSTTGQKWAVKGSKQGLFLAESNGESLAYIVEGPTDAAAGITLGLSVIGRPACLGQEQMIIEYIRLHKIRRIVLITDNDSPGLRGATKLQSMLPVFSTIFCPPAKDLREFLMLGGTAEMIAASIRDLVWVRP